MRPSVISIIILASFASIAGAIFIFNQEKKISVENVPSRQSEETIAIESFVPELSTTTAATTTEAIKDEQIIQQSVELISQAQALISEAQKFIEEEKTKIALIAEVREKSSEIKGIYVGSSRNFNVFKDILDETELNGLVIDIKESYGVNLSPSLKKSISELHQKDVWAIARIVVFRDSSLTEQNPDWYLTFASSTQAGTTTDATSTISLWQDKSSQYWLDPKNEEVANYIIDFSKKAIDYGFDELQFDYIRYPDDYEYVSGEEKIKVIGDFFAKISGALRDYKPSAILSVDLFGYVATQFNSYGTGQRLFDAGKNFDYISFMLYPSHFYGGFAAKGISYFYPEVVKHPYEVIYYSVFSARDYLSMFDLHTAIRPWLQDFDLKQDREREVFYDAEKIRLQIEGAQNATSSGWLLWNPSNVYTKEALNMVE